MRNVVVALLVSCLLGCDGHPLWVRVGGAAGAFGDGREPTGLAGAGAETGLASAPSAAAGTGATSALGGSGGGGAPGLAGAGGAKMTGAAGVTGASAPAIVVSRRGSGCGKPLPDSQPPTIPGTPKGYLHYTVMATGASLAGPQPAKAGPRTFWVRVPDDYDPNHAYRVVYVGQGCGGGVASTASLALYREAAGGTEEAIYVAPDLPTNAVCFDHESGSASEDWEAFELFHTVVDQTYCVDNDNVFAAGFSTGGYVANQWGCYFAGDGLHPWDGVPGGGGDAAPRHFAPQYHLRGQASVAGGDLASYPPCNGPVAALWIADNDDGASPIADARAALARVRKMNGCTSADPATVPWHTEATGVGNCVEYTDCPKAYPVVFCTTSGFGHSDQPQVAIPAFRLLFDEASAP